MYNSRFFEHNILTTISFYFLEVTNTPINANSNPDCKVGWLVLWLTVTIKAVCGRPLLSLHLC